MGKISVFTLLWLGLAIATAWPSTMASIAKDRVNVRTQPTLNAEVVFQAGLGLPIKIEKQQKDWVYFQDWQDNAGWVYKPLVSKIKTAVITEDNVNIRKGPSLKKPVVMQADKGEIFKIFGEKGRWVKIGWYLDNEVIGWVRQDMVWGD
jgi:SH3-like domain-containing protein